MPEDPAASQEEIPASPAETPIPPAPDATAADTPSQAPQADDNPRLYAGKYRTPEEMEAAYAEAQRKMHEEAARAAYAEKLLQQQTATQPALTPNPEPDPDAQRWERVTPYYQEKIEAYQEAGYDETQAKRLAGIDARAQFDVLKYADEQADTRSRASYEQALSQYGPYIARSRAEEQVSALGIPGVTAAELDADLREMFGAGLESLGQMPEPMQKNLLKVIAKSRAYDAGQATPKPVPSPKLPPNPAPNAGPREEAAKAPVPDAALEAAKAKIREKMPALAGNEKRLEAAAKAMLAQ